MKSSPLTPRKNGVFKKSFKKSSPESSTRHKNESKSLKYSIKQRSRNSSEQSSSLDAPSTSTGITSSKSNLYRVIEQDSDEEPRNGTESHEEDDNPEENNFISILPTPLNGTRDLYINVLEVDNDPARLNRYVHLS